jgi:hypothetical protein
MATLMNGDPTNGKQPRGRPLGAKDTKPRQPRSDTEKRQADAERRRESDTL